MLLFRLDRRWVVGPSPRGGAIPGLRDVPGRVFPGREHDPVVSGVDPFGNERLVCHRECSADRCGPHKRRGDLDPPRAQKRPLHDGRDDRPERPVERICERDLVSNALLAPPPESVRECE